MGLMREKRRVFLRVIEKAASNKQIALLCTGPIRESSGDTGA
jgi:hypothetical protein